MEKVLNHPKRVDDGIEEYRLIKDIDAFLKDYDPYEYADTDCSFASIYSDLYNSKQTIVTFLTDIVNDTECAQTRLDAANLVTRLNKF